MTTCPHCGHPIETRHGLTHRQRDLFDFIKSFTKDNGGIAPTCAEMADGVGLASRSGVNRLLNGLEERGAIRRLPNRARSIEIVEAA